MGDKLKSTEDHFVNKRRDLRGINKTFFLCLELFWLPYARHRDHVKAKLGLLTFTLQYLFFFSKPCPTHTFWHSPSAADEVRNLTFISQTSCLSKFLWPILAHQQGHIDMNLPSNVHHRIHVDRYQTNVIQMCPCLYGLSQNFCESCLNITFWPFIKRCLRFGLPFLVVCFVSAVRFDGIVAEQP